MSVEQAAVVSRGLAASGYSAWLVHRIHIQAFNLFLSARTDDERIGAQSVAQASDLVAALIQESAEQHEGG